MTTDFPLELQAIPKDKRKQLVNNYNKRQEIR